MIDREKWQNVHSPVPTDNPRETSEKHSVTGITLNNEIYMTGNIIVVEIGAYKMRQLTHQLTHQFQQLYFH